MADRFDDDALDIFHSVLADAQARNCVPMIAAALRDEYERGRTHDSEARRQALTARAVRIIFGGGA